MAFRKRVRKFVRKVGAIAKKRYVRKGGPNMKNIIKDVKMLKHLTNAEKKRTDDTQIAANSVAQINGVGVTGALAYIITPTIAQGLTNASRIGNSLKLVSCCLDFNFGSQASLLSRIEFKYYIVCRPDNSTSYPVATSLAQFFEVNPFSSVIDSFSARDPEYFSAFKVIKQGKVVLPEDSITGGFGNKQVKIPLRLNHHLKYNTNASIVTTKNELMLFVTASSGDVALLTGGTFQYNARFYYTDN